MTSAERLDLLMQRAVDEELSPAQRHELLDRLAECPDGWKRLACSFLEDQLVASGIRQSGTRRSADPCDEPTVQPLRTPRGFWYQHPALSTAISICLAFLLGLAVSGTDADRTPGVAGSVGRHAESVTVDTTPEPAGPSVTKQESLMREMELLRRTLEAFGRPDGGVP